MYILRHLTITSNSAFDNFGSPLSSNTVKQHPDCIELFKELHVVQGDVLLYSYKPSTQRNHFMHMNVIS